MKEDWRLDDQDNVSQYTALCRTHGLSHRALDWGSVESQNKRFKILSQIGMAHDESVLDIGCGLGDFYNWTQNSGLEKLRYHGIDITPALIEAARLKHPQADFRVMNILEECQPPPADYVIASGIFAKRRYDALNFAKAMIARLYDLCQKGVAFNSLNALSTGLSQEDTAFNPYEIAEHCRNLSPWVTLRLDYHPHDFTVYIRREQA